MKLELAATIVRWVVAVTGVLVVLAVIWLTPRIRIKHRVVVVFPILMTAGITINYVRATPVVFPGAVLYLVAYGYLLWTAWRIHRG